MMIEYLKRILIDFECKEFKKRTVFLKKIEDYYTIEVEISKYHFYMYICSPNAIKYEPIKAKAEYWGKIPLKGGKVKIIGEVTIEDIKRMLKTFITRCSRYFKDKTEEDIKKWIGINVNNINLDSND